MKLDREQKQGVTILAAVAVVTVIAILLMSVLTTTVNAKWMPGTDEDNVRKYIQVNCDIALGEGIGESNSGGSQVTYGIDVTNIRGTLLDEAPTVSMTFVRVHEVDMMLTATVTLVSDTDITVLVDQEIAWSLVTDEVQSISIGECVGVSEAGMYSVVVKVLVLMNDDWVVRSTMPAVSVVVA